MLTFLIEPQLTLFRSLSDYLLCTVPPLSASIVIGDRNPTAGLRFSLPCYVIGSRPTPKITWWRFDQPLDPEQYNQVIRLRDFPSSCRWIAFFLGFTVINW